MKGRRILGLAVFLSILLSLSLVFGLGILDVPMLPLGGTPPLGLSSTAVFVDPSLIIKDYLADPGYQIGDKFTVHLNISDATDVFAWQINITWDPAILNFSRVEEYGTFLRATASPNGTSGWIDRDPTKNVTIAPFNNTLGYAAIAETILGDHPGISGQGRLASVEFEVVGYGWTNLTVSASGDLATTLLNSPGDPIICDTIGGFFKNTILSDIRGPGPGNPPDGVVDGWDYGFIGLAFGKTSADPDWGDYWMADTRGPGPGNLPDGVVDGWDYGYCGLQFGQHI